MKAYQMGGQILCECGQPMHRVATMGFIIACQNPECRCKDQRFLAPQIELQEYMPWKSQKSA